jgi:hypothetical protein
LIYIENPNLAIICCFTNNGETVAILINEMELTSVRVNLERSPTNSASRTTSRRPQFPTIPLLGPIAVFTF